MPTLEELFKGSPQDKTVKAEKETFIEQETSGIRIKSAVEINNPLIYGNESTRIALRSTPLVEDMKQGTGGSGGDGGLIGGKISDARNFVNDKLGIPSAQTPTRLIDKIKDYPSSFPISEEIIGPNGNELGAFLKDSGGGNPKTLGKQLLGNGIGKAKDAIRGKLFGEGQSVGSVVGDDVELKYTNTNTYSDVLKTETLPDGTPGRNYKQEGGTAEEFKGIDLTLVSPIHGTTRKETVGRFGNTEYAFETVKKFNQDQSPYDPTEPYLGTPGEPSPISENSLELKYGLSSKGDSINKVSPSDEYKKEDFEGTDLIPFWIGHVGTRKPIFFRTLLSGISENVSPSWNTNKFVGNPYNFYTYGGVERSVTFNLKIYCMSPVELNINWEKISGLTQLAYPYINKEKLMNAPIISFRIGDIYNSKTAFIESLTYTIPDESNWETDPDIGYLPKLIDVAMTLKFIESDGAQYKPYGYKISKEGVKKINEDREAANFDTNSRVGSNGVIEKAQPLPKMDARGMTPPATPIPKIAPISLFSGKKDTTTPAESDLGSPSPLSSQPSTKDKMKEALAKEIKRLQNKYQSTSLQAVILARFSTFDEEPTKNPPFTYRIDGDVIYFKLKVSKNWYGVRPDGGIETLSRKQTKK